MTRSFEERLRSSDAANAAPRMHLNADRATAYARFIPREELGSFSAWNLRSLADGSGPEPLQPSVQRAAPSKPSEAAPEPEPQEPEQDVAALLKASRQAGYQDGYRDGLVALEAFKQSFMNQMMGQFGNLSGSFEKQLDALQEQMSSAIVKTAVNLARQVVRSELQTRPELIVQVAQEALGVLLTSARHIAVRVNPEDFATVAAGAGDALAARDARLVADPAVAQGGCVVDSDLGIVEANIETRWRRAAELIGSSAAWREDPTPAMKADRLDDAPPAAVPEEGTP